MYIIIWKYQVNPKFTEKFVEYYKSDGVWVEFFQQDVNYVGTDFFRSDNENEFLTIDSWISKEAYHSFKKTHEAKYAEIDKLCESFTISEAFLGDFTELNG